MGNLENGRRVVAWKCPFPATPSQPFLKALPSIMRFFQQCNSSCFNYTAPTDNIMITTVFSSEGPQLGTS